MAQAENSKMLIYKRILLWSLVILGMGVIGFLSSQTAPESNGLSGRTIRALLPLFMPDFPAMSWAEQSEIVAGLQSVVRDAAHVLTYFLLGILCMATLLTYEWKMKNRIAAALLIGAGYAALDELHQMFVSGRAFELYDIGLDCSGLLLGILIAVVLYRLTIRVKTYAEEG